MRSQNILSKMFIQFCSFQIIWDLKIVTKVHGYNARKANFNCVYNLRTYWNQFSLGGMIRCILVCLVSKRGLKALNFDNFDNAHDSFLWPEYFIDFFMWKMDLMSGCDIRLVFTLLPGDSTLRYKRCVHLWNNFPCIITLLIFLYVGEIKSLKFWLI